MNFSVFVCVCAQEPGRPCQSLSCWLLKVLQWPETWRHSTSLSNQRMSGQKPGLKAKEWKRNRGERKWEKGKKVGLEKKKKVTNSSRGKNPLELDKEHKWDTVTEIKTYDNRGKTEVEKFRCSVGLQGDMSFICQGDKKYSCQSPSQKIPLLIYSLCVFLSSKCG